MESNGATTPIPASTGEKAKARDILAAIRTLKRSSRSSGRATAGGAAGPRPLRRLRPGRPVDLPRSGHRPLQGRLAGPRRGTASPCSPPRNTTSAKRTTFNAFYTSPTVIAAMHEALARLGVPGDATVLEPGCGIGNFMSSAPRRACGSSASSWTAISGRIASALHPGQDIRIENFRDTKLPEGRIDAVIGNVPFADVKLDHQRPEIRLHDYFFAKSVDALKPGGVLALVTTHFTLDKQNAAIREYLAERADFLGAIRLPSDAFKREGTSGRHRHRVPAQARPGEPAHHADPDGWRRRRWTSKASTSRSTATS